MTILWPLLNQNVNQNTQMRILDATHNDPKIETQNTQNIGLNLNDGLPLEGLSLCASAWRTSVTAPLWRTSEMVTVVSF